MWANSDIIQRVIRAALDKAVPDIYKPNDVLGQLSFGNLDIRGIFTDLYTRYGQVTPDDIKKLSINIYAEWNPATPIKNFTRNIETQQVFATRASRPFHTYQLIDAALAVIQSTRQFKDEMRDYARLHPDSTTTQWHVFKNFWIQKYAEWERDRQTTQDAGYHGLNNTQGPPNDDDSLASLTQAFTTLQTQRTQQDMALHALTQQVASLTALMSNGPPQAPIPSQIHFPPAPQSFYAHPPMLYQQPPMNYPPQPAPPVYPNYAANMQFPPAPPTMGNPYAPPAPTGYTQQNSGYNNNGSGGNRGRNNNRRMDVAAAEETTREEATFATTPSTPSSTTTTGSTVPPVVSTPPTTVPTAPASDLATLQPSPVTRRLPT
jgi:hypothetical protein